VNQFSAVLKLIRHCEEWRFLKLNEFIVLSMGKLLGNESLSLTLVG
jgi:hypothetical protein